MATATPKPPLITSLADVPLSVEDAIRQTYLLRTRDLARISKHFRVSVPVVRKIVEAPEVQAKLLQVLYADVQDLKAREAANFRDDQQARTRADLGAALWETAVQQLLTNAHKLAPTDLIRLASSGSLKDLYGVQRLASGRSTTNVDVQSRDEDFQKLVEAMTKPEEVADAPSVDGGTGATEAPPEAGDVP